MNKLLKPIVKATFQTRCGCIKEFAIPYPPPQQYYFPLKRELPKMWLQHELSELPVSEVRVFGLTHYGHVQEREEGVLHVLYEELSSDAAIRKEYRESLADLVELIQDEGSYYDSDPSCCYCNDNPKATEHSKTCQVAKAKELLARE